MPEAVTIPGPLVVNGPLVAKGGSVGAAAAAVPPQTIRVRLTTAQCNAGADLVAALANVRWRLISFVMIAIGGNAATATSVRISGTQAAGVVHLATVAIAALTRSTNVSNNSANVTMLADGAGTAPCDVNTALRATVDNNNLATATHVDFILTFAGEYP